MLFHYCSQLVAETIVEDEPPYFEVGTGSNLGVGFYATDIEPDDREALEQVITQCFGGSKSLPEVNHVLVLHEGNAEVRFEQDPLDHYSWLIDAEIGDQISLETLLLEVRRFTRGKWTVVWKNPDM